MSDEDESADSGITAAERAIVTLLSDREARDSIHYEGTRQDGRTTVMSEKFAPPSVTIRRHPASRICDVVVVVRGQEVVIRCPSYSQALKWARLECKSYKIPEPSNFLDDNEPADLPLFLRQSSLPATDE